MEWQDAVFAVGGFVLAATVLPTLLSGDRPALATSLALTVVLAVYTALFITLDLPLGAAGAALQSVLWGWVFLRTRRPGGEAAATAAASEAD